MAVPPRRTLLTEMRLEQAYADHLRRLLLTASRQVQSEINKLGPSGNPLTKMQLQSTKASLNAMMDRAYVDIHKAVSEGQIAAAKAASDIVSQYENELLKAVMDPAAMKRLAASESKRTVNNLNAAMKRMEGTSYVPLSSQVYKTKQLSKGWIDDKINQALISGWDAKRLAKEVAGSINPDVKGGVSYAANRLGRTEINNAYHAASWDRYNKSGLVEEVEWLLSSSHPEDDICNDYARESPFKRNAVPAKPHPNCYCYIVPKLPTEDEFIDKLLKGEYGDEPWVTDTNPTKMAKAVEKSTAATTAVKTAYNVSQLPKLSKITDLDDPEDMAAAFGKVYGGRTYNGFKVDVTDADYAEDGIGVRMRITKNGEDAGLATRVFRDDGSVYHDMLELREEFRGQGFSTAFSEFSEAYYKANGVTQIDLHAALSNGGYAWAKAGYSWNPKQYYYHEASETTYRPTEVIGNIRGKLRQGERVTDPDASRYLTAGNKETMDGFLKRFESTNRDEWPTPAELANAQGDPVKFVSGFDGKTSYIPLGKYLMDGTGWYGVKPMAG